MSKPIKYILIACVFIIILGALYLFAVNFNGYNKDEVKIQHVIYDTSVITRYETKLKHDTVIKWYEKIIYKQLEPEKVYVQKVDTQFIEKSKSMDVMLNVRKKGRDLTIYALNQNGMLLKEYHYTVGDDFTATSATDRLVVKTKKFYWTGIDANTEVYMKPQDIIHNNFYTKFKYRASVETGISYYDYVRLKLGVERDFGTGENLVKLKTSFKILN